MDDEKNQIECQSCGRPFVPQKQDQEICEECLALGRVFAPNPKLLRRMPPPKPRNQES